MPDLWYYGRNEQRYGPVPLKKLQWLASSGDLDASDLVWSPGMADWTAASEVDGLFSEPASAVASAPPPTPEVTSPPAVPTEAEVLVAEERWHYELQGERFGPVSFMVLQLFADSGKIGQDNLVWKRGMAEWLPAGQVEGLFPAQAKPATEPADLWYYGDGEQRHGPVSTDELKALASCGRLQPDDFVWNRGMEEWTPAAEVAGIFPVEVESRPRSETPAPQKPREPVVPPVPTPTLKEQVQHIRDAAAPHLSRAATATRTNLGRFRKFVHRQHLGMRLRLLLASMARGAVRCYNAARPHVMRAWSKKPSKQEVKDWSAAKAQQASKTWKQTAPQRSRLAQWISVGLSRTWRGLLYCWHAPGRFAAWSWRQARNLGTGLANAIGTLWSSLKPKPRPASAPKPKSVLVPLRSPPPMPKPQTVASASQPQSSVLAATASPSEPESVVLTAAVPPRMPKPVRLAAQIPPPMPKPASPAARVPPPMPKTVREPTVIPTVETATKPYASAISAPAPDIQSTTVPITEPKSPATEPDRAQAVQGIIPTECEARRHGDTNNPTDDPQRVRQPKDG